MCCAKYGLLGLLLSGLVGRGSCCPTEVPVQVALNVAPAAVVQGTDTAVVTATLASAYSEEARLTLKADQTPNTTTPAFSLSDTAIVIPAGQTQGSVTVTPEALPAGVASVQVVFRVSQVAAEQCSWDVDVPANPLTITAPGGGGGGGGGENNGGGGGGGTQLGGSLQVTLCPDEAVAEGVQWNVDDGPWQDSGVTITDLTAGTHTVNYNGTGIWLAPPSEEVTIVDGQTTTVDTCFDP